jgi:glucose 1-dehydrogenase
MGKKVEQENLPSVVMPSCEMRKILAGQKALATGANSGIGKTVAIALGQAGADVVVNYVTNPGQAEEVVAKIRESGVKAYAHQADVSQEDQVKAMFARMCEEFGTIDIMVNNAGLQRDAKLEEMTLRQWDTVIGVNLTGQFLCAREAVREFKRRGVRPEISCAAGKIICISSVHEVIPWAGHVNYAASKGGVMLMMKSIAQEVAPHRIRVNSVCPGAIRTPINTAAWSTAEAYASLMQLVPYKRIGEPEDIGRVVAWLASDEADYITGASIYVDGGMTLYPGFATGG